MGQNMGGMNTKLHAVCDCQIRPIDFFVTAGQVSDYIGAWALLSRLPPFLLLIEGDLRGFQLGLREIARVERETNLTPGFNIPELFKCRTTIMPPMSTPLEVLSPHDLGSLCQNLYQDRFSTNP